MDKGILKTLAEIEAYVLGGRGKITIESIKTGAHFTYRFRIPKETRNGDKPIFVSVLTGSDNTSNFTFIGTLWGTVWGIRYQHSRKSRIGSYANSVKAFDWIIRHLNQNIELHDKARIFHEGICGRCGRTLTVPESIKNGIGPVCLARTA